MDDYMILRNGKKVYRDVATKSGRKNPTPVIKPRFRLFNSLTELFVFFLWFAIIALIFLMNLEICPDDIFEMCDRFVNNVFN